MPLYPPVYLRCPKCGHIVCSEPLVDVQNKTTSSFLGISLSSVKIVYYFFTCPLCHHHWYTSDISKDMGKSAYRSQTHVNNEDGDDASIDYDVIVEQLIESCKNATNKHDYEKTISEVQKIENKIDEDDEDLQFSCNAIKAICLSKVGDIQKGIELLKECDSYDEDETKQLITLISSESIQQTPVDTYECMLNVAHILEDNDEDDLEGFFYSYSAIKKIYSTLKKSFYSNFESIPFDRRRYLVVINDYKENVDFEEIPENLLLIEKKQVPPSLIFPSEKPSVGVLYIANPVKPNIYYKADEYELCSFRDQLNEFMVVLSQLGAKRLSFHDIRTSESTHEITGRHNYSGKFNEDSIYSINGHYGNERMEKSYIKLCHEYFREMEFEQGNVIPSIIEGPWYSIMPEWQVLANQRLIQGTVLKDHRRISLSESASIRDEIKETLEAEFDSLIFSGSGSHDYDIDELFNENYDFCWEYEVEFYPLSQYAVQSDNNGKSSKVLSEAELEYLEEFKSIISEGEIGQRERNSLERMRTRLGIPLERTQELEAQVIPILTDKEKKYFEELKEILTEGEIGQRERSSLERYRLRLGINSERAIEIESYVKTNNAQ